MKPIEKHHKLLSRFIAPMIMSALLCITSPSFAGIVPLVSKPVTVIAQNQSGLSLEQKAQSYYNKGEFSQAAKLFQEAIQIYKTKTKTKTSSDRIRQALSLSNLSLCYQQLGKWDAARDAINEAIALLKGLRNKNSQNKNSQTVLALAQALDIQGSLELVRGQTNDALESWKSATVIYTQQNKPLQALGSQTNQAKALQNLGLYRRAITLLEKALKLPSNPSSNTEPEKLKTLLQGISASSETANALHILGDSLRVVGNFPQAKLVLQRSLDIAKQLDLKDTVTLAQLALGNTARAQIGLDKLSPNNNTDTAIDTEMVQVALNFYQQAAKSDKANLRLISQINQLSLLVDRKQIDAAKSLLPQVKQQLDTLPPSHSGIEARLHFARTMMQIQKQTSNIISLREIAQILAVAVQQAQDLSDSTIEADALGSLGNVYERSQQWSEAENLTKRALQLTQQSHSPHIVYLWQWQLGRILTAQGKTDDAIAAYQEAVNMIKSLRADLASASSDVQFSFKDAIEPIHRQFVSLLVKSNQKANLKMARDVIEELQLVELDNFFREPCLTANPAQVDLVDEKAAVIYPIILEDELAVIVSLPKSSLAKSSLPKSSLSKSKNQSQASSQKQANRDFRYYKTAIRREQLEELTSNLRDDLQQPTALDLALPQLQKIYDLVIRPEAADLLASQVKTLVFVLDDALRNIPMAALHDGENFLVEKYSIALTSGLKLLAPRALTEERLEVLVAGLNVGRPPDFLPLPYVEKEVTEIKSKLPSQVLFNQKFTNRRFANKLPTASSPIVHLATHGQFGSTADETFILTWDGKINVNQLSSILEKVELSRNQPLELLVLSACQTAAGDARSALGLAGVATRSGARSTIATLWRVNDKASANLVSQLYEQLAQVSKTGISKAEALRRAQLSILNNPQYQSPYYWGAYVLLGNWT